MSLKPDYHKLCATLQYQFNKLEYLDTALRHRSAGNPNNERLEFLGDALLGFIIAEMLYTRFPNASEGDLTRQRATLVRRETLAEIAQQRLDLGRYLHLGGGELKSGGWRRASILADALEAIIGAIYLDANQQFPVCRTAVLHLYQDHLKHLSASALSLQKDPKTRLQEYLQAHQQPLPTYQVLHIEGDPPTQHFTVSCQTTLLVQPLVGEGTSRRNAEQSAAALMLSHLQNAKR